MLPERASELQALVDVCVCGYETVTSGMRRRVVHGTTGHPRDADRSVHQPSTPAVSTPGPKRAKDAAPLPDSIAIAAPACLIADSDSATGAWCAATTRGAWRRPCSSSRDDRRSCRPPCARWSPSDAASNRFPNILPATGGSPESSPSRGNQGDTMNWREWLADDRLLAVDQVESTAVLLLQVGTRGEQPAI